MRNILALPLLLGTLATPTLAATPSANDAPLPLTETQLNIYVTMGAVNVCSLNKQGVAPKKAMQSSVDMIASSFYEIHGGMIGTKKVPQQNFVGLILPNLLYKTRALCLGSLPKEDQDRINTDLTKFEAAVKEAQTKK